MNQGGPWVGKSVMIVDDSYLVREELKESFADIGMNVVACAENGMEALRLFDLHKPDLVTFDIIMPEMHGIECFRILTEKDPQLKFVFITCLAKDQHALDAYSQEIPSSHILPKPVSRERLTEALDVVFTRAAPLPVGA